MLHKLISKVFVVIAVCACALTAHAYTKPGNPTGYVNDYAKVLSSEQVRLLDDQLTAFEATTTSQIAVVTIPSLDGDTIENYAVKLFEDWKIGQKGKDNGILLLVAVNDHKVRIEVGYGLEGALPDSIANRIIQDEMIPKFKSNDYYGGIQAGVDKIILATEGEYQATSSPIPENIRSIPFPVILFCLVFFLSFVNFLSRSKSWWFGGVAGALLGVVVSAFVGLLWGAILTIVLTFFGLLIDFLVSRGKFPGGSNFRGPWGGWGGGSSGSSGGGFGGFGGGSSGGGGASGGW